MSAFKKSDVKNHLSRRRPSGIHLYQPVSQPDATGFSGDESRHTDSSATPAVQTPAEQPASGELNYPSTLTEPALKPVLVPAAPKSAQA